MADMTITSLFLVLQTIVTATPLPHDWGVVEVHQLVETDGRTETTEAIVRSLITFESRVVQVRPDGTSCAGPWFYWASDPYAWVQFRTVDGRTRAFVTQAHHYVEMTIETPSCP